MLLESYTAPIDRNVTWRGGFASEPYECAWAREAVFFVRTLSGGSFARAVIADVQISPDGMIWVNEGTTIELPRSPGLAFCRVRHFGGWLRLAGEMPGDGSLRVLVYLVLKA